MPPDYLRLGSTQIRLSEGDALSRAESSSCENSQNHNQKQNPYYEPALISGYDADCSGIEPLEPEAHLVQHRLRTKMTRV
jgi:hypothetical protein